MAVQNYILLFLQIYVMHLRHGAIHPPRDWMISRFRKNGSDRSRAYPVLRAWWLSAVWCKIISLQWPGLKASVQSIYMESWSIIISVY